jgi:hypothetical protein
MADEPAEVRHVIRFDLLSYSEDEAGDASLLFQDIAGRPFILIGSMTCIAAVGARLNEMRQELSKKGTKLKIPSNPERVIEYGAEPSPYNEDEVHILLNGDRSNPLLGRMHKSAARILAAQLMVAAERAPTPRAN